MVFDSNFECGNLDRACIISLTEYNLYLNSDTNSKGNSQWFYFAVINTEEGKTVTFHILNCTKFVPLFKTGMKPLVFSELEYEKNGAEWVPEAINVSYAKNIAASEENGDQKAVPNKYFTLSFSHTFKNSGDRVYFAYSKPYSVSMARDFFKQLKENLVLQAKTATILKEDDLQNRIEDFIKTSTIQKEEKKEKLQREDEIRKRPPRKSLVQQPEESLVDSNILKEYATQEQGNRLEWQKSQDYLIETDSFIYRKETLSHTLSGHPVELYTITAYRYLFHPYIKSRTKNFPVRKRKIVFITARVHAASSRFI